MDARRAPLSLGQGHFLRLDEYSVFSWRHAVAGADGAQLESAVGPNRAVGGMRDALFEFLEVDPTSLHRRAIGEHDFAANGVMARSASRNEERDRDQPTQVHSS